MTCGAGVGKLTVRVYVRLHRNIRQLQYNTFRGSTRVSSRIVP